MTFEQFWQRYPRKVGKHAALREWERIKPRGKTNKQIAAALDWQVPLWSDPKFIPHPSTWLHQGRWLDEQEAVPGRAPPVAEPWICRHVEHCAHQAMCQVKRMQPEKYPIRDL